MAKRCCTYILDQYSRRWADFIFSIVIATEGFFLLNYIKFILQVIENILNTTKIIHVDVLKDEIILDGKIQLGVV